MINNLFSIKKKTIKNNSNCYLYNQKTMNPPYMRVPKQLPLLGSSVSENGLPFNSLRVLASQKNECFWNQTFDKGRLKNFVLWFLKKYGEYKTILLVEELKNIGFQYATKAGISLGIEDLKIPKKKYALLMEAEQLSIATLKQYKRGEITGVERFQRLIDTWHRTSERLKQEVIENFESTDILNPVYMMAFSGARGNISQVRQLVGMRGLMSNPQGQIIDFPIRSNFREGLTLTEYIISSYGARKGIVDTALRTANAGYLTRRLVDVAQHVIISNFNCGTKHGIFLTDMKEGNKIIYSLQSRLVGRVLGEDIYNDLKIKVASRNSEISVDLATSLARISTKVFVRSSLTCKTKKLICQLCYGWSLAQGNLVSIGEAVGVVAAQSIGEPGTQLTMRTFHTGGVFSGDVSDQIRAPFDGIVKFTNPIAGTLIRTPEGKIAFLTKNEGSFIVESLPFKQDFITGDAANLPTGRDRLSNFISDRKIKKFKIPFYTLLFLKNGEKVSEKEVIAQISSINRQKNITDVAELTIKSELSGQFYSKFLDLKENKVGPDKKNNEENDEENLTERVIKSSVIKMYKGKLTEQTKEILPTAVDTIFEAWGWGYAWVLSGKIYKLSLSSSFFPILGDYINSKSYMNQINWNISPSFGTSFKLNVPISMQLLNANKKFLNKNLIKQMRKSNNKGIVNILNQNELTLLKTELISFQLSKILYKKIGYFLKLTEPSSSFCFNENNFNNYFKLSFKEKLSIISTHDTLFLFSSIFSKNNSNLPFTPYGQKTVYPGVGARSKNNNNKRNSVYPANWGPSFNIFLNWFPKYLSTKTGGLIFMEPTLFPKTAGIGFLRKPTITPHGVKEPSLQSKLTLKLQHNFKQSNFATHPYGVSGLSNTLANNLINAKNEKLSSYNKVALRDLSGNDKDFKNSKLPIQKSFMNQKNLSSSYSLWNLPFKLSSVSTRLLVIEENKLKPNYGVKGYRFLNRHCFNAEYLDNDTNILNTKIINIKSKASGFVPLPLTCSLREQVTSGPLSTGGVSQIEDKNNKNLSKFSTNFNKKIINLHNTRLFPTFIKRDRLAGKEVDLLQSNKSKVDFSLEKSKKPNYYNLIELDKTKNNLEQLTLSGFKSSAAPLNYGNYIKVPNNLFKFGSEINKSKIKIILNKKTTELAKTLIFKQTLSFGSSIYPIRGSAGSLNLNGKNKSDPFNLGMNWKNSFKRNNNSSLNNKSFDLSCSAQAKGQATSKSSLLPRIFWIPQTFYNFNLKNNKIYPSLDALNPATGGLEHLNNKLNSILLQINRQGNIKSFNLKEGYLQTNLTTLPLLTQPLCGNNLFFEKKSNEVSQLSKTKKIFKKDGIYYFTSFDKKLNNTLKKRKNIINTYSNSRKNKQYKVESKNTLTPNSFTPPMGRLVRGGNSGVRSYFTKANVTTDPLNKLNLKIYSKLVSLPYFLNKKSVVFLKNNLLSRRSRGKINSKVKHTRKNKYHSGVMSLRGRQKTKSVFNFYFYSLFNKNYQYRDIFNLKKIKQSDNFNSTCWLETLTHLLKNKDLKITDLKNKDIKLLKRKNNKINKINVKIGSFLVDIQKYLMFSKFNFQKLNNENRNKDITFSTKILLNLIKQHKFKLICSPYLIDQCNSLQLTCINDKNKVKTLANDRINPPNPQGLGGLASGQVDNRLKTNSHIKSLNFLFFERKKRLQYWFKKSKFSKKIYLKNLLKINKKLNVLLFKRKLTTKKTYFIFLKQKRKINSLLQKNNKAQSSKLNKKNGVLTPHRGGSNRGTELFKSQFKTILKPELILQNKTIGVHKINNTGLIKEKTQKSSIKIVKARKNSIESLETSTQNKTNQNQLLNLMLKSGWLYYSTNLSDLVLYNKKLINPGKIISNELVFDRHSVFLEIISFDKIKFKNFNLLSSITSKLISTKRNLLTTNSQVSINLLPSKEFKMGTDIDLNLIKTIKNNKCRFEPISPIGEKTNKLNYDKIFFILIRKAFEYKRHKDTEYKKEIYKISNQKNNGPISHSLHNLKSAIISPFNITSNTKKSSKLKLTFNQDLEFKSTYEKNYFKSEISPVSGSNPSKVISSNSPTGGLEIVPLQSLHYKTKNYTATSLNNIKKLINKPYNSINLYSLYKTGFLNKQKLTAQIISKYPSTDLKIFSNSSFYSSLFELKQNLFQNTVSFLLPLQGNQFSNKKFNLKLLQSNYSLKINKAGSKGLPGLPITVTKPVNLSPFMVSYKVPYSLDFPFKKPITLFSEQSSHSFFGNSSFRFRSGFVTSFPSKTSTQMNLGPQKSLKKILYSCLLKINNFRNLTILDDLESKKTTSEREINVSPIDLFDNEKLLLEMSKTISNLSSIFANPIIEYSLGKEFEKSICYPNNLISPQKKLLSLSSRDNNLFILNKNSIDNKNFLSGVNGPVLGSLNQIFEYNCNKIMNKETPLYKSKFISFRNNNINTQLPLIKTYTFSSFEGEVIYKNSNSLNSPQSILSSTTKYKKEGKNLTKKTHNLTLDLFINQNKDNGCIILTKKDLLAFYFPKNQKMKEIYFSLENLKRQNQYLINDIVINYLNIIEDQTLSGGLETVGYINPVEGYKEVVTPVGGTVPLGKSKNQKLEKDESSTFTPPAGGLVKEGTTFTNDNEIIIKINKLPAGNAQQKSKLSIGEFLVYGDQISSNLAIPKSGQIIHINNNKLTIRRGQPIFVSPKSILHKYDGDFIEEQASVITLAYQQLKTGDIIQGIPKVEQFFEARTTKRGRVFRDSLANLLKALFKLYCKEFPLENAVRLSFYKIQQIIIDGVHRVYRSQGVTIADKHLEVIVKQMTSKVRIINPKMRGFSRGEIVDLDYIEKINRRLTNKIIYEPLVLGITKASLEVDSFLSAASFQQTTRVLSKSAIERKKDFLKGLKENVLLGNLIPAGTGSLIYLDEKPFLSTKINSTTNLKINSDQILDKNPSLDSKPKIKKS